MPKIGSLTPKLVPANARRQTTHCSATNQPANTARTTVKSHNDHRRIRLEARRALRLTLSRRRSAKFQFAAKNPPTISAATTKAIAPETYLVVRAVWKPTLSNHHH